jgi:hypothetical protein
MLKPTRQAQTHILPPNRSQDFTRRAAHTPQDSTVRALRVYYPSSLSHPHLPLIYSLYLRRPTAEQMSSRDICRDQVRHGPLLSNNNSKQLEQQQTYMRLQHSRARPSLLPFLCPRRLQPPVSHLDVACIQSARRDIKYRASAAGHHIQSTKESFRLLRRRARCSTYCSAWYLHWVVIYNLHCIQRNAQTVIRALLAAHARLDMATSVALQVRAGRIAGPRYFQRRAWPVCGHRARVASARRPIRPRICQCPSRARSAASPVERARR